MSFLDTDFTIDLLREQRRQVVGPAHRKLQQLGDAPIRLSLFVVCELEAGAALSHNPEERERVRRLYQECEVVYPDERFARYTARLSLPLNERNNDCDDGPPDRHPGFSTER